MLLKEFFRYVFLNVLGMIANILSLVATAIYTGIAQGMQPILRAVPTAKEKKAICKPF
ncbi:MAG: hypothetical protein NC307_03850 [Roseburia sp.]|nr:hypothetical protein [Roseburia sp.]